MSKAVKKKSRSWALFNLFNFLLGFALLLLMCGFIVFVIVVKTSKPPQIITKADGIVVLTGKGGGRLQAGGLLLKNKHAERLLVSGVNPAISEEEVQSLLGLSRKQTTCCVDLDYNAENTYDNGRETANWASALGYEEIILVTSDYHMPRAEIEITTAQKRLRIISYPVKTENTGEKSWRSRTDYAKRLLREYAKLLVSLARDIGTKSNKQLEKTTDAQ